MSFYHYSVVAIPSYIVYDIDFHVVMCVMNIQVVGPYFRGVRVQIGYMCINHPVSESLAFFFIMQCQSLTPFYRSDHDQFLF